MRKLVDILGVKIDRIDKEFACQSILNFINEEKKEGQNQRLIVTPNSEMIVRAKENQQLARILNEADLSTADGAGVVLAARLLAKPVPERVAGFDLMYAVLKAIANTTNSCYFLGGKPGIVDQAVIRLQEELLGLRICGFHHGYLDQEVEEQIIREINVLKPDLLLVGMGVPLQEKFLDRNLAKLKVKAAMTVGGSFDVLAGEVQRAPYWMQRIGLEWFYRLLQEPSRFGRMLALPKFMLLVFRELIRK